MPLHTVSEVESYLVAHLSSRLGIEARSIDLREPFSRYGLDSLGTSALLSELGGQLGRVLSPTLAWEYPTIAALARYLVEGTKTATSAADAHSLGDQPIAVVGMACRFPQAASLAAFWDLLCRGGDAITTVPTDRWNADSLYDPDVFAPGKINTRWGGFLDQVDQFDPLFFGISPKEAAQMDPQQRLVLELSWEALEDAGIPAHSLKGSRTGVFMGVVWTDYGILAHAGGLQAFSQHTLTGFHHSIVANRISYTLGLEGPSMCLDTACSSSLVAIHLACESLRRRESTLALVGGANLNIVPESTLIVAKSGSLSPDGRCFTFDARANGYVRGEGSGIVVLKPLAAALADGDPIYCVIRGSRVNNDGASNGLTAPNPRAQEVLLREAYAQAEVPAGEVGYVELHGTGTQLGDPIEAIALGRVLGAQRPVEHPLLVGSVKTNIGHLEAASGIAGLIKTALCIQHRMIPPSLHFRTLNPNIPAHLNLRVQTALGEWPELPGAPLATAGVSSFGMGGTNAHVVLQEFAPPRLQLLALSSSTADGLQGAVRQHLAALDAAVEDSPSAWWQPPVSADGHQRFRLALVARGRQDLSRALLRYLGDSAEPGFFTGDASLGEGARPVFVFSGQGSQWVGMGRSLFQSEPVFRAQLKHCDRLIAQHLGWSLIDELLASERFARLDRIDVTCPAIVTVQIALAALLRSWGIEPAAVVGHSIGEVAAAHVAGALSLEDAMQVICTQGRVIHKISGQGAMALVAVTWAQAADLLVRYAPRLCRAIQASPDTTVIAGDPSALTELCAELTAQGVFCRRIDVAVAAHSPQLDPLREVLLEGLVGVKPRRAEVPIYSGTTGGVLAGEKFDAPHWVRNLAEPVYFATALSAGIAAGHRLFLELAPHPLLSHAIASTLKAAGQIGLAIPTLQRQEPERRSLLEALGRMYAAGFALPLPPAGSNAPSTPVAADLDDPVQILPLSARSAGALEDLARNVQSLLLHKEGAAAPDLAYTAALRRSHHAYRLAVVGKTKEEWSAALTTFVQGGTTPGLASGRAPSDWPPKLVFIFSGQGSQWLGMGRELVASEPAFRAALVLCDEEIRKESGVSVLATLNDDNPQWLERPERVQPVLFAVQVGLAALWRSWGVVPAAVVGTSMGEVAAAYVSGALSLEDAVRVICRRIKLIQTVKGHGAMALVELSVAAAQKFVHEHSAHLAIAASNGPRSTILSGDPQALESLLARLEADGIFCRRLPGGNAASHSPQMEPLQADLLAALAELSPRAAHTAMYSTVTRAEVTAGMLDAAYWYRNMRESVLFWPTIELLRARGHELFVELSPHPILLPALREVAPKADREFVLLGSLRRGQPERRSLLETLSELYVRGQRVHWEQLHRDGGQCIKLPTYPWQRERYWIEAPAPTAQGLLPKRTRSDAGHPLLGEHFSVATQPGARFWQQWIDVSELPYLSEHRIRGHAVFPGTGYLEMALAAARQVGQGGNVTLTDVQFERMFVLDKAHLLQTAIILHESGRAEFSIASQDGEPWVRHAVGAVQWQGEVRDPEPVGETAAVVIQRCTIRRSKAQHYQRMQQTGVDYGPHFQGVEELWVSEHEVLARISVPPTGSANLAPYQLHPAWLDACFHSSLSALGITGMDIYAPVELARLELYRSKIDASMGPVWAHTRITPGPDCFVVDVRVLLTDGTTVLRAQGLKLQRLAGISTAPRAVEEQWLYEVQWQKQRLTKNSLGSERGTGDWLVFAAAQDSSSATVVAALQQGGARCIVVEAGDQYRRLGAGRYQINAAAPQDYRTLLQEVYGPTKACPAVVHLWSLDATPAEQLTAEQLEKDQDLGCRSALYLVQALLRSGARTLPRLYLVTRGAQQVSATDSVLALSQAPLWGLGQSIALEHPELHCTRVDLNPLGTASELGALTAELSAGSAETQVALRGNYRYVARLVHSSFHHDEPLAQPIIGGAASYLVTGGLGGLGLLAGEWLVAQGARHVVLMGRSAPGESALRVIEQLQAGGAEVIAVTCDLTRPDEVAALVAQFGQSWPPLRGILHAAAVLDDGILMEQSWQRFTAVMAPKMYGAWQLHALTLDQPLDFFVLYSSVASLLGVPGQANYVAANSFLDALAHYRRQLGRCALSVNWGLFSEAGIVARRADLTLRFTARGMQTLTPAQGYQTLLQLMASDHVQVGVTKLNVEEWLAYFPELAASPYWSELAREHTLALPVGGTPKVEFLTTLLAAKEEDRRGLLEARLKEQLGQVLRLAVGRIDPRTPFMQLGLDSLMSVDLRNRLDTDLHISVPIALLLSNASIVRLATFILKQLPDPTIESAAEPIDEGEV